MLCGNITTLHVMLCNITFHTSECPLRFALTLACSFSLCFCVDTMRKVHGAKLRPRSSR